MAKVTEVKGAKKGGRTFFVENGHGCIYVACDGFDGLATQIIAHEAMKTAGLESMGYGKNIDTGHGYLLFGHAYKRSIFDRLFGGITNTYVCQKLASYCCE
ncbi:MAG: hypothetical protein IJ880_15445 [Bacilli bacterium]|nr:hypothetical protein [Bacilli bacterium]